jgi:hypothetical protein
VVLPADIKRAIARLDPGSFTAFVEGLLLAERARLALPPNAVVLSDAITEADEGLDGRVEAVPEYAPDGSRSNLPVGLVGLQFKTTRRKQPSALKLDDELAKPGPTKILERRGTYVLVWSQDLNDPQRRVTEAALQAAADKIAAGANVVVWDATALAVLADMYPAVAADVGLADFLAALSLPELLSSTTLRADERPWQADPARDGHVARIRERAVNSSDPLLMGVLGDPGTGKTRLVAHALDSDETRDSVLYVNGAESLQLLLTRLVRSSASRGILFVDEIDDHEIATAHGRVGGLQGRWRLITVTSRSSHRWAPPGPRDIVLEPLSPEATTQLVEQYSGLETTQARMVAEVAAGFPELAFRLAQELREDPSLDLVRLSRLRQPQEVLKRALGNSEARRHLAPLALFTSVGFDDELRYQLEAIAAGFELSATAIEAHARIELGRFVSRAGRYRLVSPRLVAIWLATDLIETTPGFAEIVFGLPEPLRDSFVEQLDFFGPDVPFLPDALTEVLRDPRFRRPSGFDEAAGRLLRASAAIIPSQVVAAVAEILASATAERLRSMPRRDLVWTLEVLLWWPATWRQAIESLYLLAQHENESFANNATGQFVQFFSIYLSGTTVPFADRAAWLHDAIVTATSDELDLLTDASAAGLEEHHSRSVTGFRGGGEPVDWRPQTNEEYFTARRAAWDLLVLCLDRRSVDDARLATTSKIAHGIGAAYRSTLATHVNSSLRSRTWSTQERAVLASGVRNVMRHESEMPAEVRELANALHDWLLGDDLDSRGAVVLSSSLWDLFIEDASAYEPPSLLVDLVDRLARSEEPVAHAVTLGRGIDEQETRHQMLRLVAQRFGSEQLVQAVTGGEVVDWTAITAALAEADARGEAEWATRFLTRATEARWVERLPQLVRFVSPTHDRIELVLDVVEAGRADGAELGQLLYGARAAELPEALMLRVVRAAADAGRLEESLGILDQWLDRHAERSPELRATATTLAQAAIGAGRGGMLEHHLERLLRTDVLDSGAVLALWEERMVHRSGLPSSFDRELTTRALASEPAEVAERIVSLILRQADGEGTFGLYSMGSLGLLSRLAQVLSVDYVWNLVGGLPKRELRWAMHHMRWWGNEPDELVRRLLLSDRLVEVEGAASACFFNTLGTVSGSLAAALERELERARSWQALLRDSSASDWAGKLVAGYEAHVEQERLREAEERRFG